MKRQAACGQRWKADFIQSKVAAVRSERQRPIDVSAITGTSDYPNLSETPAAVLEVAKVSAPKESNTKITAEALPRIRLAEPYEALREASDRVVTKTRARPKVFLANLGKPSDFTARTTFAKNFYEAGGIEAATSEGFKDKAAMIAAFKASGAKLACLCSSDKIYESDAAGAAKALTAAGAIVHLAGRPGEQEENWRQAGIKSFIYVGCNALSTLRAAHDNLGIK